MWSVTPAFGEKGGKRGTAAPPPEQHPCYQALQGGMFALKCRLSPPQIPTLATCPRLMPTALGTAFHQVTYRPGSRLQEPLALDKSQALPFHFSLCLFFSYRLCLKSLSTAIYLPRETTEAQICCIQVVKGLDFLTVRNGTSGVK